MHVGAQQHHYFLFSKWLCVSFTRRPDTQYRIVVTKYTSAFLSTRSPSCKLTITRCRLHGIRERSDDALLLKSVSLRNLYPTHRPYHHLAYTMLAQLPPAPGQAAAFAHEKAYCIGNRVRQEGDLPSIIFTFAGVSMQKRSPLRSPHTFSHQEK